jgi:hypothetical protein
MRCAGDLSHVIGRSPTLCGEAVDFLRLPLPGSAVAANVCDDITYFF